MSVLILVPSFSASPRISVLHLIYGFKMVAVWIILFYQFDLIVALNISEVSGFDNGVCVFSYDLLFSLIRFLFLTREKLFYYVICEW